VHRRDYAAPWNSGKVNVAFAPVWPRSLGTPDPQREDRLIGPGKCVAARVRIADSGNSDEATASRAIMVFSGLVPAELW